MTPIEGSKLPSEVRASLWLAEVCNGTTLRTIARREQVGMRCVQSAVFRARLRELEQVHRRRINVRTPLDLAARFGEPGSTQAARAAIPRLVPLFPIGPFTPATTCGHRHPIRAGSVFCCMVCHSSGYDDHPSLTRDPKNEPEPEPVVQKPEPIKTSGPAKASSSSARKAETRKQRRKQQFASAAAMVATA